MIDTHMHSSYSMDSTTPSDELAKKAIELGMKYIAITDHYNRDFDDIIEPYRSTSKELKNPLDLSGHIDDIHRLNGLYGDKLTIGVGVECGYSKSSESAYLDTIDRSKFDTIVNSIHVVNREDIYYDCFYDGKDRDYVLRSYLEKIRESVDAKYDYDVIAHIGYISRKAPYPSGKNLLTMDEYGKEIDDILKAIIRRNKALECNAKSKNTPFDFLPGREILEEYYRLGGRIISYGSDAHNTTRVGEKYDLIASIAKEIGFSGFTYFYKGKAHLEKF